MAKTKRKKVKNKMGLKNFLWEAGAKAIIVTDKALDLAFDFLVDKAGPALKEILKDICEIGHDGMECCCLRPIHFRT